MMFDDAKKSRKKGQKMTIRINNMKVTDSLILFIFLLKKSTSNYN